MTKDNLGSEQWQSDRETIRSLTEQLKALADAEKALRVQNDELMRTVAWLTQERDHLQAAIRNAVDAIAEDGGTDGAHHKQWVLDQVVHLLLGDGYDAWIAEYNKPGYIQWDTGIAP